MEIRRDEEIFKFWLKSYLVLRLSFVYGSKKYTKKVEGENNEKSAFQKLTNFFHLQFCFPPQVLKQLSRNQSGFWEQLLD